MFVSSACAYVPAFLTRILYTSFSLSISLLGVTCFARRRRRRSAILVVRVDKTMLSARHVPTHKSTGVGRKNGRAAMVTLPFN